MADFSCFLAAKSCEVPSLILLPWQQLKIQRTVSQRCIFKVRKFQLDTLSRFGMMEEKQEGGVFPPPGKIGLRLIKALDNRFYVKFMQL